MIEGVPARLEGAPRRVRREWSEAFKERIVAETLLPGANVSAIARPEGIAPPQLLVWRRKGIRNGTVRPTDAAEGPHFVDVETAASSTIEIVIDGVVGADVSEARLRRVIRAVRSA
ncbi:transposase [Mesorhizobium sp. BHbdii]